MSWSDILYPGNNDRREAIARKLQDLLDAMSYNFRATNKLVQYLNDNIITTNLSKIYIDPTKSLRDNADVLVNQIRAIDVVLDAIDEKLKQKLEPELYKKLTNVDTSFERKVCIKSSFFIIYVIGLFFVFFLSVLYYYYTDPQYNPM